MYAHVFGKTEMGTRGEQGETDRHTHTHTHTHTHKERERRRTGEGVGGALGETFQRRVGRAQALRGAKGRLGLHFLTLLKVDWPKSK